MGHVHRAIHEECRLIPNGPPFLVESARFPGGFSDQAKSGLNRRETRTTVDVTHRIREVIQCGWRVRSGEDRPSASGHRFASDLACSECGILRDAHQRQPPPSATNESNTKDRVLPVAFMRSSSRSTLGEPITFGDPRPGSESRGGVAWRNTCAFGSREKMSSSSLG